MNTIGTLQWSAVLVGKESHLQWDSNLRLCELNRVIVTVVVVM